MKPFLIERSDARRTLLCEICGTEAEGWPNGWTQSGRSRVRIPIERGTLPACWCPKCRVVCDKWVNPPTSHIKQIREQLVAEKPA